MADVTTGWHPTSPATSGPPADKPSGPAPPPPPAWRNWLLPIGVALSLLLLLRPVVQEPPRSLSYTDFLVAVDRGDVEAVAIGPDGHTRGVLRDGTGFITAIPVELSGDQLLARLEDASVEIEAVPPRPTLGGILLSLAPFLLLLALFVWMGRRAEGQFAGAMGIGRSKAKVFDSERPKTTFADVAGYEGVKREVAEVVDFLRQPDRFRRAGARAPRGILMAGPPGTGKTLLARALAGEAQVPFLSVTGSSFVELFVGVGAARVRDLFAEARKRAPAIIFVDEIDAIGQRRSGGAMVANDEREQTLNQLLAEMDGFDPAEGIVVLAATNRPEALDPALLRPGRFDRQVTVPLPNRGERRAILEVHCRSKRLAEDVNLDVVARGTPGFSGADLANLVNEAAIVAVRAGREIVTAADFEEARDRIILGRREGSNVLLPDERRAVAVHEAGHALVAGLSDHADPVAKVTILPAGQALGVTHQLPVDERHLYSESYLHDSLAVRLGGRAAELVAFGEASTGAANDLAGATELATRMVREFGLSAALGPVGYSAQGPMYLGGQEVHHRAWAEQTQRVIDTEVTRLLRDAEQRAVDLLKDHRVELDKLTELLLEHETIDGETVYQLIGRPIPGSQAAPQPTAAAADTLAGSQLSPWAGHGNEPNIAAPEGVAPLRIRVASCADPVGTSQQRHPQLAPLRRVDSDLTTEVTRSMPGGMWRRHASLTRRGLCSSR
ncbi:MAG: ATP-dependent zinc metalloprotease FtsH [Actinomycetota bacterium]|nr:ATP-dependent zinc metalloprotease FtsH [Actinomycetota bacterium]